MSCSTCDLTNFQKVNGNPSILVNPLGISRELELCYNKSTKTFYLSVAPSRSSNFIAYRCPTCGRKLY